MGFGTVHVEFDAVLIAIHSLDIFLAKASHMIPRMTFHMLIKHVDVPGCSGILKIVFF